MAAAQPANRLGVPPTTFLLALATFAIGTDAFIIAGILPAIAQDLRVGLPAAGLVVSVFSLAYAVGAPVVSALSAPFSRRTVLAGGMAVFALANLLSAISPNLLLLCLTRVLAALTAGLVAPACYGLASALGGPQARGRNLAVIAAGFMVATVLGVPLGVLIGCTFTWRGAFGFVAVLGLVAAGVLARLRLSPLCGTGRASLATLGRLLADPRTLVVMTPFVVWSAGNFGLYTYIGALLGHSLSPAVVPALLLMFGVGGGLGNLLGGMASDRHGVRWPPILFLVVQAAVLFAIGPASHTLSLAVPAVLIWAICMAGLFTLQQQRVIAAQSQQANLMLALNNSALYLGAAIGPAVDGAVVCRLGLPATPLASAGLALAGLVLLLVLPAADSRAPPSHRAQRR